MERSSISESCNADPYENCGITDLLRNVHSSYHPAAFMLVIGVNFGAKAACYIHSRKLDE